MTTEFTWDPVKANSNVRKHGVTFELGRLVFGDPNVVIELERHVDGKERWQAIGRIGEHLILLVVHTTWDEGEIEIIRIISARRAENHERKIYEEQRRRTSGGPR
jgi:uncharacterized protein